MTEEQVKTVVREAVSEALKTANIIDGPTHIAHHQAIEEQLQLFRHAKKGLVSVIISGLAGLIAWGLWAWVHHGKP